MAEQTLRWRGLYRYIYAKALVALTEHARENPEPEFSFGPMDLRALVSQGLVVTGSDLTAVRDILDGIHGLSQVPA